MPQVLVMLGKFLLAKMAAKMVVLAVIEAVEKGAAKTETQWDDELANELKKNKDDIIKLLQGAL